MRLFALLLLGASVAARADVCPQLPARPSVRLPPAESLGFKLDAMGAEVGTFDLQMEPAPPAERPRAAWLLRTRARTNAFVSTNVKQYGAFVTVLLSPDFSVLRYREDVDEGDLHRAQEIDFPPVDGTLTVRATKAGKPEPFAVAAGRNVREMLSTLYVLRGLPLGRGEPVCLEVYSGGKIWKMEGRVAAKETIDTPLGRFPALRFDALATRIDDPAVTRIAHLWLTDDDKRLPLAAVGTVRGKTIRAQLVEASSLPRKRAQLRDEQRRNAIGR